MSSVKDLVESKIHGKKIMVFSKTTCPFCKAAKELLKKCYIDRKVVSPDDVEYMELERHRDGEAIKTYLQRKTGQRTVPRIFVNGKTVGGFDDLKAKHQKGEIKKMLEATTN